jgi:hypothetical protein
MFHFILEIFINSSGFYHVIALEARLYYDSIGNFNTRRTIAVIFDRYIDI